MRSSARGPVPRRPRARRWLDVRLGPRAGAGAGAGVVAGEAGPGAGKSAADPLVLIRRSALDVLGMLRRLEEAMRHPPEDGTSDTSADAQGLRAPSPPHTLVLERSSSSLGPGGTSELAFALVQVHGRPESIPVWEEEEDGFGPGEDDDARALAGARRELWEARLRGAAPARRRGVAVPRGCRDSRNGRRETRGGRVA